MGAIKVKEINLERGYPTAELAIREMINHLGTYKRQGYRALVFIHGYGSTGSGGKIKMAVKSKLKDSSLRGIVQDFCGGEHWMDRKKEMLAHCEQLRQFEPDISGNFGVTVVLLK